MSPILEVVDSAPANPRELDRDRNPWNLPRRPRDAESYEAPIQSDSESGLDWEGFSARYFPASRRHDLTAIVAYAAYKHASSHGSEKAEMPDQLIGEALAETVAQ